MGKITSFLLLVFLSASCTSSNSDGDKIPLAAPVKMGAQWGYINKSGKTAINPQFDWAGEFEEGLALIRLGSKYGYVDKTGEIAIKPQFDYAEDFQEGRARILLDGKWGYIDKNGNIATNPQFDGTEDF